MGMRLRVGYFVGFWWRRLGGDSSATSRESAALGSWDIHAREQRSL